MALRLSHEILELETKHPFGIARGTASLYRVVWVRLDGAALLKHDPFVGATIGGGRVTLPTGPGLGVTQR
jgi:hypothetical protein